MTTSSMLGRKKKQEKADRKKERMYQTGSSYIACVSDDWRSYSPLGDRKTPPPKGHTHSTRRASREKVGKMCIRKSGDGGPPNPTFPLTINNNPDISHRKWGGGDNERPKQDGGAERNRCRLLDSRPPPPPPSAAQQQPGVRRFR